MNPKLNIVKLIAGSPTALVEYLDSEDSADLHDGSIKLWLHGNKYPLADVAIVAAFLPPDERDAILTDIKAAVTAWVEQNESVEA